MSAIGADPTSPAEYGRTKAAGERAVPEPHFPRPPSIAHLSYSGPTTTSSIAASLARFSPVLPVFKTKFQPVYVGDVADAYTAVLRDPGTSGKLYELAVRG